MQPDMGAVGFTGQEAGEGLRWRHAGRSQDTDIFSYKPHSAPSKKNKIQVTLFHRNLNLKIFLVFKVYILPWEYRAPLEYALVQDSQCRIC
jgi:hypothetical protein